MDVHSGKFSPSDEIPTPEWNPARCGPRHPSPIWINRTALTDLQREKDLLERGAAALRQSLHELRQAGREHTLPAHVWQAEFARQHEKLVLVASKIGGLDKRILALVEGKDKQRDPPAKER
jgi:hypothetical protein